MIKKNKGSLSQLNLSHNNKQHKKSENKVAQQPRFCYQKKYRDQQSSFSPDKFQETTQRIPTNKFRLDNHSYSIEDIPHKTPKYHMNSQYEETKDYKPLPRQPNRQIVRDTSTDNFKKDELTKLNLWQTFGKEQTPKKEQSHPRSRPSAPVLQSSDLNRERKSSYRLKYEYSNNYLVGTKKSSYYQFIRDKIELQPSHRKSILVEDPKFKPEIPVRRGGAGSSYKFSEHEYFY